MLLLLHGQALSVLLPSYGTGKLDVLLFSSEVRVRKIRKLFASGGKGLAYFKTKRDDNFPGNGVVQVPIGVSRLCLVLILGFGTYLRLRQFADQVLLDDEWHAVHQLLSGKSPFELFLTLGYSDYSIPLGLLYWLEAHSVGLSEAGMRWPMLIIGLMTLVLFTAFVWRNYSKPVALIFAALLGLSPMLVIYGHTARPYALTLFLSYLAHYAFYRFWRADNRQFAWGLGYCVSAAFSTWLHSIAGPFVVAPLIVEGVVALSHRRWNELRRLSLMALAAGVLIGMLIGPPLVSDPLSLAVKAGLGALELETIEGIWFMWLGTPSNFCVAALLLLALFGLKRLLSKAPLMRSALFGVLLTLLTLIFSQPAWIQHSLTAGRYLLPALPLLLLAVAVGVAEVWKALARYGRTVLTLYLAVMVSLFAGYVALSPTWSVVRTPNSNMTHLLFQFDFRSGHNAVADYQSMIPLSDFWNQFADVPRNSLELTVAPFYFESYNWDGPRWESASGQRVKPAYITGYCVPQRFGEVPKTALYRFHNAHYVKDLATSAEVSADWLIYTKPFTGFEDGADGKLVGGNLSQCSDRLRTDFGIPDYEDEYLFAFDLNRLRAR